MMDITSWPESNLEKFWLIEFAMKLQNNILTEQTQLINNNNKFWEKLRIFDCKSDELKKENEIIKSKVWVLEKILLTLSSNYKSMNEKGIEMERNMQWLD